MKFLSMIRLDETTAQPPSERLMQEMGKLMDEMMAIELTKRFLAIHGDEWNLECEVRPFDGDEFCA